MEGLGAKTQNMAPNASKQERGTELTACQAIHLIDLRITRRLLPRTILVERRDRLGGVMGVCHRPIASYEADRRPTHRATPLTPSDENQPSKGVYFRSAVETRFLATVGWCALFRTETA